jgi:tetratricopeptide (TPR) repeat protein
MNWSRKSRRRCAPDAGRAVLRTPRHIIPFFRFAGVLAIGLLAVFSRCTPGPPAGEENAGDDTSAVAQIETLSSRIESDPGNARLHHERARAYIREKAFQKALDDMVSAVKLDSTQPAFYLTLSDIFFATNRMFDARQALESCLEYDENNAEARSKLAEIYFIVRKYQLAMDQTVRLLELDPSNTRALFMQGMILKEAGDTTAAINRFQRAIELDERFYEPYMQLGVLYTARENPVCVEYFTGALRIRPNSEEALYGRALWYQEHDDLDRAMQDYTSIVQINPRNKNAHFNMGYLHYTYLKVYDQAIKHYSDAIAVDSSYAEAFYNRGLCYEALGDVAAAAADYAHALSIRPGYQLAQEGLTRVQ